MKDYIELLCKIKPYSAIISEILVAELGELGFESFVEQEDALQAYIIDSEFDESKINNLIGSLNIDSELEFSFKKIKQENWNETWEKNYFQPIVIAGKCVIRSTFHPDFPDIPYRITIDPKMAFGTGHHETTSLMITEILQLNLKAKTLLDMGCGTGILAILASLKGAGEITAIDYDIWSYNNTVENMAINNTHNISAVHGDVKAIKGKTYDVIFANINKNVLLADIPEYAKCLNKGGILLLSGFYRTDVNDINAVATKNGLSLNHDNELNNWVMLKYLKDVK